MKSHARCYQSLREYVETVPLVDCHDHTAECGPKYVDPIQVVVSGCFVHDVISASCDRDAAFIQDSSQPLEERWPVLERVWKRTCHTGYARVTRLVLKQFYDEDELTLDALERMATKLPDLSDEKLFDDILGQANIAVRLENVLYADDPTPDGIGIKRVLDGSVKLSPRGRLVIPLPQFHRVASHDAVQATAEEVFNWLMEDPRRSASYPDQVRPLDEYLFHQFMRMARDMDLPVQVHTGHMAGVRNDIVKTNAVGLTRVIELHRDVRFDLFHANWPYSGEALFLGKNYPNVAIDFWWANIIDPIYCQNMFKQAISSVPHGKIHGYGSDFGGHADRAWAHASIARDNIAIALAELVQMAYLGLDDAKEVARGWLFDNAKAFFRLGRIRDVD